MRSFHISRSATTWRRPGASARERSLGWDDAAWSRFGDGIKRVGDRCRERGYEPTLHHHTGTYLEAVWEIDRAPEVSDVGLCLDTGHLLVGGGDPVERIQAAARYPIGSLRETDTKFETRWD